MSPIELQDRDKWISVLTAIPPSSIWTYAQYFLITELADRKWEAEEIYRKQKNESEQNLESLDDLTKTWAKIMLLLSGLFIIILKIFMLAFFYIGFINKNCKEYITQIEKSLKEKADCACKSKKNLRVKTVDEIGAEKGIEYFRDMVDSLLKNSADNIYIKAYINNFLSSVMAIGQRWAVAELNCRATESSQDRAEALWRGGFMIRAFGFGTIKLIRQLLAILAIGMAVPFLINLFAKTPNYSIIANLAQGIGWTAILWAITLALTLFLNDRRMAKIWKRAKLASLLAQKTRSEELIQVFDEVKNAIQNCLTPLINSIEDSILKLLILDNMRQIDELIKREESKLKNFDSEIAMIKQNLKLIEKIKQILDTSSQGDAIEQVTDGITDAF